MRAGPYVECQPSLFTYGMKPHMLISKAEMRVLRLISQNRSSSQIATELGLKPKTVENHRYNIARKLDLSGNNCVLRYALQHKDEL